MGAQEAQDRHVVGGVDTHKDLRVAAVVDDRDRVLASDGFAATRQGYPQMLAWMRTFGALRRVGVESTDSYGAGLLRFLQPAGIEVLEVTSPDTGSSAGQERRLRCPECGARRLRRHPRRHAADTGPTATSFPRPANNVNEF